MKEFTFSSKLKAIIYSMMGLGLLTLLVAIFADTSEHYGRFWTNILINAFFFLAIALGAVFFIALQHAAEVGWSVVLRRVLEAIMGYLKVGAIILIIVFLAASLHWNHIYHWMQAGIDDPQNPLYDEIIANKKPYLNLPFFWIRTLIYLGSWVYFANWFRKASLLKDNLKGQELINKHFSSQKMAAIFLVIFSVTSSTASWDWIMSIDTHWFSTLFGWYVFSGMWCSTMIVLSLLVTYLKYKGLLKEVNESHLHDINKWMFATSFLWSYMWFAQFLLIWYSNIPEEVTYFITRIQHYPYLFFSTFFINFVFPMVILIARDTKRNIKFYLPIAVLIFFGHWLDVYLMVTPGVLDSHWNFGWMEVGLFIGFLGLFLFTIFTNLTKAALSVAEDPYLEESKHLHH